MASKLLSELEKEKIGLDIDDSTIDFARLFLEDYNIRNGTKFRKADLSGYFISKILGVTPEQMQMEFDTFYASPNFNKLPLIDGAAESIRLLHQRYLFPIVTTRPYYLKTPTLENISLHFDGQLKEVYFVPREQKAAKYIEIGVKKVIDDDLKVILDLTETIMEMFLVDQPWNQIQNLPENVIRVGDWKNGVSPWPEIKRRLTK